MAQKVEIRLISDLSGTDADETVSFALDNNTYELDLTSKEADKFRGLFQDYIAVARKSGRRSGGGSKRTQSGPAASEIREWASQNGYDVPARGRIPSEIRDAYNAAH